MSVEIIGLIIGKKIEDYLKYKGIQNIDGVIVGGVNEATESEGSSNQGDSI